VEINHEITRGHDKIITWASRVDVSGVRMWFPKQTLLHFSLAVGNRNYTHVIDNATGPCLKCLPDR
jgi:hypothetical protein